jgi:hypothetical protein
LASVAVKLLEAVPNFQAEKWLACDDFPRMGNFPKKSLYRFLGGVKLTTA